MSLSFPTFSYHYFRRNGEFRYNINSIIDNNIGNTTKQIEARIVKSVLSVNLKSVRFPEYIIN